MCFQYKWSKSRKKRKSKEKDRHNRQSSHLSQISTYTSEDLEKAHPSVLQSSFSPREEK